MERNDVHKLIVLKSARVTFEANSGKVSSNVWKHGGVGMGMGTGFSATAV